MKFISKLPIVIVLLLLASCGATHEVAINAMEPARVDLSDKIVRVGILNSAEQLEESYLGKGIDRLVAIEDQWLIKKGQDAALFGLMDELIKDNRFDVQLLDSTIDGLEDIKNNSEAISWASIKSVCEKYNIDALFHLTHFDAETQISLRKTKMEQLNMLREKEEIAAQEITLETLIQNGWRIYDPFLEKIVDEYTYDQHIVTKAKGLDPVAALRAISSRKDSILSTGQFAGNSYGERLKPYERKIYRTYYVKGSDKLVQAGKNMDLGDVPSAIQLWQEEASHLKPKIKGRACHNLAVGMELGGDLVQALAWASKANESLSDKNSQEYLTELESRMSQRTIVQAQLAQVNFGD